MNCGSCLCTTQSNEAIKTVPLGTNACCPVCGADYAQPCEILAAAVAAKSSGTIGEWSADR